jgi:polar amino acid transport system permease protein
MAGATIESQSFRSLETYLVIAVIYIAITFAFQLVYWLVGLWLFGRRVAAGDATSAAILDVQEAKP